MRARNRRTSGIRATCGVLQEATRVKLNLRPGPEMEKVVAEVDSYKPFLELMRELIEVNEKICQLRRVRQVDDEEQLEALKKNCGGVCQEAEQEIGRMVNRIFRWRGLVPGLRFCNSLQTHSLRPMEDWWENRRITGPAPLFPLV